LRSEGGERTSVKLVNRCDSDGYGVVGTFVTAQQLFESNGKLAASSTWLWTSSVVMRVVKRYGQSNWM
jgi:hypothetical protein